MDEYEPKDFRRGQIGNLRARVRTLHRAGMLKRINQLLDRLDVADRLLDDQRVSEIQRHLRVDEELGEVDALIHIERS